MPNAEKYDLRPLPKQKNTLREQLALMRGQMQEEFESWKKTPIHNIQHPEDGMAAYEFICYGIESERADRADRLKNAAACAKFPVRMQCYKRDSVALSLAA